MAIGYRGSVDTTEDGPVSADDDSIEAIAARSGVESSSSNSAHSSARSRRKRFAMGWTVR